MTVLTYAVQTEIAEITPWVGVPAPLMASSGAPLTGALTITITNLTASTVTITSIAFKFDVGTGAALMASASSLQPAPQSGPWVVSNYSETNGVVLEPGVDELGQLEVGESITVQLYGFPTIAAPATAVIGITEKLTPGTSSSSGTLYVTTYAPEFFFNGLTANIMQGSIPVPVAQVLAGTAVTLTWNTSVTERTSITVVYSDPLQGQQTGTLSEPNQWTTPQGLLADTVFTVSVTGTTAGGETATVSESVAVSVLDPTLGNVNVGGDVGAAEPATATLAVTGEVTVAASSSQPTALAVTGNVTVSSATTSGSTFGGTLTTDLLVAGATTNPTPPRPNRNRSCRSSAPCSPTCGSRARWWPGTRLSPPETSTGALATPAVRS